MELTKYEHACFTLQKDTQLLVIDPGNFTTDFISPSNVTAIVITHEHSDHFDHEQIAAIAAENPNVVIVGHPSITDQIEVFQTISVLPGDELTTGPFSLRFFGSEHAVIHPDIAPIANLGILVNDLLYYPGDSFVRPDVPVDTLALPVGAPWLKLAEAVNFVHDIKPRFVFPTHDAVLSDIGKGLADRLVPQLVPSIEYKRLDTSVLV